MALDLSRTVQQIEDLAERLSDTRDGRDQRLGLALAAMREADLEQLKAKAVSSQGRPYLWRTPWERSLARTHRRKRPPISVSRR